LHAQGYRYRLHDRSLPGKPDIVFKSRKKAIFIHGCFWHQHPDAKCPITGYPASNLKYWEPKLNRTIERDAASLAALKTVGWKSLVIWECELANEKKLVKRLQAFLELKK